MGHTEKAGDQTENVSDEQFLRLCWETDGCIVCPGTREYTAKAPFGGIVAFIQQKIDFSSSFQAPECVLSKHKGNLNLAQWTDKRVFAKGWT